MIVSKKKNNISLFRRALGMTQSEAGEILRCKKSNISNMESEKGTPTEAYKTILNIAPTELDDHLTDYTKRLFLDGNLVQNPPQHCKPKRTVTVKMPTDFDRNKLKYHGSGALPIYRDDLSKTDLMVLEKHRAYPSINIKEDEILFIRPSLSYKDKKTVVYQENLNTFELATVSDKGNKLIPVDKSLPIINFWDVTVLGYLVNNF